MSVFDLMKGGAKPNGIANPAPSIMDGMIGSAVAKMMEHPEVGNNIRQVADFCRSINAKLDAIDERQERLQFELADLRAFIIRARRVHSDEPDTGRSASASADAGANDGAARTD